MDVEFVDEERRAYGEMRYGRVREERKNNNACIKGEKTTMNQQVHKGGGLLITGPPPTD